MRLTPHIVGVDLHRASQYTLKLKSGLRLTKLHLTIFIWGCALARVIALVQHSPLEQQRQKHMLMCAEAGLACQQLRITQDLNKLYQIHSWNPLVRLVINFATRNVLMDSSVPSAIDLRLFYVLPKCNLWHTTRPSLSGVYPGRVYGRWRSNRDSRYLLGILQHEPSVAVF